MKKISSQKRNKSIFPKSYKKNTIKTNLKNSNKKDKFVQSTNIARALYRKYSGSQNYFYLNIIDSLVNQVTPNSFGIKYEDMRQFTTKQQILTKFYQKKVLKIQFKNTVRLFQVHRELPRLFILEVCDIINKCHHKKRLIQYYRLAKNLNFTVQEDQFSSFFCTLNNKKVLSRNQTFQKLIQNISSYSFTHETQQNPQKILIGHLEDFLQNFIPTATSTPQNF